MSRKKLRWGSLDVIEISVSSQPSPTRSSSRSSKRSLSQGDDIIDLTEDPILKKPKLLEKLVKDLQDEISPRSTEELAVHVNKIKELRGWFEDYERRKQKKPNPMLLVTGPCGSAKLTTVKVLAKDMEYEVFEYESPQDVDSLDFGMGSDQPIAEKRMHDQHLLKFLRNTSRFGSIYDEPARKKKLLVVKDFPHIFLRKPDLFENILVEYQKFGKSPLIFITNETRSKACNLNFLLFPDATQVKFGIGLISFNPVSNTALNKVLTSLAALMKKEPYCRVYNKPDSDTITSVVLSSQGDIRNAVINLLFACQKNAVRIERSGKELAPSKKFTGRKFRNLGADENLTIFHALGKIFRPKTEDSRFVNAPEDLADQFAGESGTFMKLLFVNYLGHFTELNEAARFLDFYSLADTFMNTFDDDLRLYGLILGMRGGMICNTKPPGGFRAVQGYNSLFNKVLRESGDGHVASRESDCDYKEYRKLIFKQPEIDIEGVFSDEDEVMHFE